MPTQEVFRFGEFTLDVGGRRLLRGAEAVRLSPKAHDVLVELVRQEGRLMTKAETLSLLPTDLAPAVNLQIRMTATDDRTLSFLLLRKRDQFLEALPFVNERYDSVRDVSLRIC